MSRESGLVRWSGVCALIGGAMWTYKSIVILATGDQPDYWFELALVWFGVSVLFLVYALKDRLGRPSRSLSTGGCLQSL